MIHIFDDLDALSDAAARYIASYAQECVGSRGRFTWLLSGGSTPVTTYRLLAGSPYSEQAFWWKTHFYWGDERCVPPNSDQSNYYLAKESLLDHVPTPDAQIHRMPGERGDRDQAADEYAAILPGRPDLNLLGMGSNGHTASLFPGSPALEEVQRRVVAAEASGDIQPHWRLTITPPVLGAVERTLVLAAGPDKAEALERVFSPEGSIQETPARLVRDAVWLVDRAAAARTLKLDLGGIHRMHTG